MNTIIRTTVPHTNIAALLADPCWLPMHLDLATLQMELVRIDRAARRAVTFLDEEYLRDQRTRATIPIEEVLPATSGKNAVHFIFHSAFACSTLLARVLDIPGISTSLSEPAVLNELAHFARERRLDRQLLGAVLALLGRGFEEEAVVLKPSNVVNNLIDDIFALCPNAKAVLLYKPLPEFLLSIARKGLFGRIWARRCFAQLRNDGWFNAGFSESETFTQTDLQIAASLWIAHHHQFADLAQRYPDRVRSLDSRSFLARKAESLAGISAFFGLRFDAAAVASGLSFSSHAKTIGRDFDGDDYAASLTADHSAHAEEISMVTTWSQKVAEFLDVPTDPGARLLGE